MIKPLRTPNTPKETNDPSNFIDPHHRNEHHQRYNSISAPPAL
ncbi:hypothetical protein AAKU64_004237 [Undibacterium sp. GrIS 1.8]